MIPGDSGPRDELFRIAIERAPVGMLLVDEAGIVQLCNVEASRIFGYAEGELVGLPVELLLPSALRVGHVRHRANYLERASPRLMGAGRDLHGVREDGALVPVEIGLNPLRFQGETLVLSSVVDLTARRQAERALRESEERFRLLVDGVQDHAVLMLDEAGCVVSWNAGAERLTGHAAEAIMGRRLEVFRTRERGRSGSADVLLDLARRDGHGREEGWRRRRDGSSFLAEELVTCLRHPDGAVRGYAVLLRDVSAQRALEERVRQSQKLEAIGTLAAGVAHDFNNLLTAILGYAELAMAAAEGSPSLRRDLEAVVVAAQRGRQLVQRMLTFSRTDATPRVRQDLAGIVEETLAFLRASMPATIALHARLDAATPAVDADATQVQQVLMNLATNAAAAMGEAGGALDVALAPVNVTDELTRSMPGLQPGLHACITVSDTGAGIAPEVLHRIFEPFFTTKPRGEGTGLGLAVVHGIVRAHGGAINVVSTVGKGTSVQVFLPASIEEVDREATDEAVAPPPRARVLYVEDEEILAVLAERQLRAAGYHVTMHRSSLQALEEFRARPRAFDIVVTDNTMPHMTGVQLAARLIALRQDLPILMVSGVLETMPMEEVLAQGVRRVLGKPFVARELVAAVEAVLADGLAPAPEGGASTD